MLAKLKSEGFFLALQPEVLDSFRSEQQTLEEISSSNTDHENAGPLHMVTSSSSEYYDPLPCKNWVKQHCLRKKTFI